MKKILGVKRPPKLGVKQPGCETTGNHMYIYKKKYQPVFHIWPNVKMYYLYVGGLGLLILLVPFKIWKKTDFVGKNPNYYNTNYIGGGGGGFCALYLEFRGAIISLKETSSQIQWIQSTYNMWKHSSKSFMKCLRTQWTRQRNDD